MSDTETTPRRLGRPKGIPATEATKQKLSENYNGVLGFSIAGRDAAILAASLRGEMHAVLAARFHITRERVRQIIKREGGPTGKAGITARKVKRLDRNAVRRRAAKETARQKKVAFVRGMVEMRLRGATFAEIGVAFGYEHINAATTPHHFLRWAARQPEFAEVADKLPPPKTKMRRRFAAEELDTIGQLLAAHVPKTEIARRLGRHPQSVHNAIKYYGIPKP